MTTAVAMQPPMPRPAPIPIAAACHKPKQSMPGTENASQTKPSSTGTITNARGRKERPCDACRRRKSRCVIHEGAVLCVLCEFHKQECTFVQSPQPRKRKLNADGKKDESVKKRSVEVSPSQPAIQTPPIAPTIPPSPQIRPTERGNAVFGETLGLQYHIHSRYIGPTTPLDPLLIGLSHFDIHNQTAFHLGTLRRVNDHECFIMLPDETTQIYDRDAEIFDAVEQIVAPHGLALIDIYFRVVHPSFPIIQRTIFYERLRNGDRPLSPALLAGIYILALNWWSHDPSLAALPKPNTGRLEAIASRSLALAMERPKLSTIQAGLLLLQRSEADSWSLTTQLVAIGQELGLHLDCSDWSIPLWERGLRKRIAWALYMQDKWSSLTQGRPSHIFGANWAVKPITEDDFLEEGEHGGTELHRHEDDRAEDERGRIIFAQMIALTNIMSEVMDTFYTQVAIQDFANAGKNSTRLILERAKPVQIKLKEWFAKLPATVRMDNSPTNRLCSTGYLHLAYFATEITLHRRIVQSLDSKDADPYLMYICRSAAKTRLISAMDFVNRLRPEHLQAFWFFASKINFTLIGTFGSLLWATAPAREEAEFYKSRLREYRWTLSVSSKRAEFLEYAVAMLDSTRAMLNNLAEKPSISEARVSSTGAPDRYAHRQEQPDQQDHEMGNTSDMQQFSRFSSSGPAFSGFTDEEMHAQYSSRGQTPPTPQSHH